MDNMHLHLKEKLPSVIAFFKIGYSCDQIVVHIYIFLLKYIIITNTGFYKSIPFDRNKDVYIFRDQ